MTLGEKIKYYRKQNKYSQEKVAELTGVSRQAVTKWESNQSSPSTDNLLKLAKIFDISLNEFINDTSEHQISNQLSLKSTIIMRAPILIGVIIVFIAIAAIIFRSALLWTILNLMLLLVYITLGIYIIRLLIKALKKYIHTS